MATTLVVLIALLLPMATLIERFAFEDAIAAASLEAQATESVVGLSERSDIVTFLDDLNSIEDGPRTTVLFGDGDAIGPHREVTPEVRQARRTRSAVTRDTELGVEVLVPVAVGAEQPLNVEPAPIPDSEVPVIRVIIRDEQLREDVLLAWLMLGVLGIGLLMLAAYVADRLARNLVASTTDLAHVSHRLAAGDLQARTRLQGPPEIREVGTTLNQLAERIRELLTAERESVADVSHRLRTPVTVLRLAASELRDHQEREQLVGYVDEVTDTLTDVIREARTPVHTGLGVRSDATAVTKARTAFWAMVADDQDRRLDVDLPSGPVEVKVLGEDLGAAIDALLDNVFSHTPEGTGCRVHLHDGTGVATLSVTDSGPGGVDPEVVLRRGESRGGSTGLGMDIARRTAEASGGRLEINSEHGRGTTVTMLLGRA